MQKEWWVYETWMVVAGGKAIVHHGDCPFCNHGRGIHSNVSNRNDQWHGCYPSVDAAMTKAISLGRTDTRRARATRWRTSPLKGYAHV